MISMEICRDMGLVRVSPAESELLTDVLEEDSSEEESRPVEEKLKTVWDKDEFRLCSWLREQPYIAIVTSHDLNYNFPVFEAVFSPPELRFS